MFNDRFYFYNMTLHSSIVFIIKHFLGFKLLKHKKKLLPCNIVNRQTKEKLPRKYLDNNNNNLWFYIYSYRYN